MRRLILFAFAIAITAQAQTTRVPSQYKRLLLPFHTSAGEFNTGFWAVDWWFRNDGPVAADAFPLAAFCGLPPPGGLRYYAKPSLPAETTLTCLAGDVLPSFPVPPIVPVLATAPGAFLYVESAAAKQIHVGGSIAWTHGNGPLAGAAGADLRHPAAAVEHAPRSAADDDPAAVQLPLERTPAVPRSL